MAEPAGSRQVAWNLPTGADWKSAPAFVRDLCRAIERACWNPHHDLCQHLDHQSPVLKNKAADAHDAARQRRLDIRRKTAVVAALLLIVSRIDTVSLILGDRPDADALGYRVDRMAEALGIPLRTFERALQIIHRMAWLDSTRRTYTETRNGRHEKRARTSIRRLSPELLASVGMAGRWATAAKKARQDRFSKADQAKRARMRLKTRQGIAIAAAEAARVLAGEKALQRATDQRNAEFRRQLDTNRPAVGHRRRPT